MYYVVKNYVKYKLVINDFERTYDQYFGVLFLG